MMMLRESHPHKPHVSSVVTEGTERESVMHVRCVHSKCKSKTKLTKVRFLRKPKERMPLEDPREKNLISQPNYVVWDRGLCYVSYV